jgi:curved DNA-binding protein
VKNGGPFIDHYAALQVEPDCDTRALESAYRQLAKQFHPDHGDTADVDCLNAVIAAYRALRDPEKRADYDADHSAATGRSWQEYYTNGRATEEEKTALDDGEIHDLILRTLYRKRRESAGDPGVPPFTVQELLHCSDEHFAFHEWYLKQKGFVETTENGTLAITIHGVDHVISSSRSANAEKLRIGHASERLS